MTVLRWVAARLDGCPATGIGSARLRHHLDGTAGALRHADAAALAVVVVEFEALAGPELAHRVVGADAVAVVALEAVAARQAAPRFVQRVAFVEAALNFVEARLAADDVEHRPHRLWRIGVIPGVQRFEAGRRGPRPQRRRLAAQPRVDMARRLFAMTDRDRHVAFG